MFNRTNLTLNSEVDQDIEQQHDITNNVVCVTSKGSDQPVQMRSLNSLNVL